MLLVAAPGDARRGARAEGPAPARATPAGAAWTPRSSDLVFMSNRSGNAEIYRLPAGDTTWVNLTNHAAGDNWPEWSPDGNRIAFQSNRSGNLDIWVMNADGSGLARLTDHPEPDYLPTWSPDGRSIVFASWRREPGDTARANHTYVMHADGSGQRRMFVESPRVSAGATWSPDGTKLVTDRGRDDGGADVFVVDPTGRVLQRLTDDPAFDGSAAFSPDGSRVAFYSDHADTSRLVIVGLDGTRRVLPPDAVHNWYPRWSPDGRWLVYTVAVPGGAKGDLDLRAVPLEGPTTPVTLVGGPGREAEGRWRPGAPAGAGAPDAR
jgi:TolB protein